MLYIKKFNEEEKITDWIKYPLIKSKCELLGLENYTINDNETVDVNGDVNISWKKLQKIPIQFGIVSESFDCSYNHLISLKGCPKTANGDFFCNNNKLTSLKGGPKEVNGNYYCASNKLISLDYGPDKLFGGLLCYDNPIWEIYNLFDDYKKYGDSLDYNYLRGRNIIKLRFREALEEIGIMEIPESIPGYKYI